MTLLIGSLTIGLILSLLALGVFISFKLFDFPDITVEGSITFGAAITASMILAGVHPMIASIVAFVGGFIAGALTGILHTKLRINGFLAGILVMTALFSLNLRIMGKSNVPLMSHTTLITMIEDLGSTISGGTEIIKILGWSVVFRDFFVLLIILGLVALVIILLYLFFKTNIGTAMRATGDNQQMVRALGVNSKMMITLGLAISNGMIGLSGSLLAQYQGFADVQMGIGMLVWGFASVIIGEALITQKTLGYLMIAAVIGSMLFRMLVAITLKLGMNPNDLKLITAIFVLLALIMPQITKRIRKNKKPLFADYRK